MTTPAHILSMDTRELACALVAHVVCGWDTAFHWADVAPRAAADVIYHAMKARIGK